MFGSVLRHCMISVTVVLLGAGSAMADIAVPPDTVDGAYGVLERLGLLPKEAPPPRETAPAPAPASVPPSAATAAPAPQEPASEAYGVLERLGLLQKQEPLAPAAEAAPATVVSPASETASAAPAPASAAPAPESAAAVAPVAAAPAPASARSRSTAGAFGMLERLGMVYKQEPPAPASDPASADATAPAPSPATGTGLVETGVAGEAAATTVADVSALRAEAVTRAPEPHSYQVLRRLGLLKPDPSATGVIGPLHAKPRIDRVVVEKSKRRLYVVRDGAKYREYPIALGAMPNGPKVQAGDLRTPEGVYTLDWRNPKSRFYKAIHISYPSPVDRMRAEEKGVDPGGMIMIHGEHYEPAMRRVLRRKPKDWTEGCIALNNEHMDELWHTVPVGTPIEIRP